MKLSMMMKTMSRLSFKNERLLPKLFLPPRKKGLPNQQLQPKMLSFCLLFQDESRLEPPKLIPRLVTKIVIFLLLETRNMLLYPHQTMSLLKMLMSFHYGKRPFTATKKTSTSISHTPRQIQEFFATKGTFNDFSEVSFGIHFR